MVFENIQWCQNYLFVDKLCTPGIWGFNLGYTLRLIEDLILSTDIMVNICVSKFIASYLVVLLLEDDHPII